MPVTPVGTRNPGDYPDTVRHISNGDPVNQTYLKNPSIDLELRTEALKDALNALDTAAFDEIADVLNQLATHSHSGSSIPSERVMDFAQVYANTGTGNAFFCLVEDGELAIKKNGGSSAPDLLRLSDAGTEPKEQVIFPGSVALFDHEAALASDLTLSPHGLRLAARPFIISTGCLVASTADDSTITLAPTTASGGVYAAPGLFGKAEGDLTPGSLAEGVITGSPTDTASDFPQHLVMVHDTTTGDLILVGQDPVYGLLAYTGSAWQLTFRVAGGAHTFLTSGGAKTLRLIGQEAYSLSTVPVVDPRFALMAKLGIKRV